MGIVARLGRAVLVLRCPARVASVSCPFITLLPREDNDYDVVRCERPPGHDDRHHTTDRRAEHRPAWSLEWAYDPEGGVDESDSE